MKSRSQYILSLFHDHRTNEEEMPVDQDPNWMEPKRIGGTGAPRPQSDHYPAKGVGGIPSGSPEVYQRKQNQNTFPWGGAIRNSQQLHIYGDPSRGGL